MHFNQSIVKLFVGCCINSFIMEIIMYKLPQCANLITFLQFFFISLQGFIVTTKFGTVKPKIPLIQYTYLITLFFITSVLNNYVYALHVPSTLHMIIRSASSPASLLVSCCVKKQKPKITKLVGSILISVGVAIAMYGDATGGNKSEEKLFLWCIGVGILLSTLFLGAFLGLQQETIFSKYGKHPEEMLFYTHAIPLPLFLGLYPGLRDLTYNLSLDMWILVALNITSQFFCAHSVHELATKETSVTVTFILTLRKFISLLISSILFKSYLTVSHVIGSIFVAIGTYVYFDYFVNIKQRPVSFKEKL